MKKIFILGITVLILSFGFISCKDDDGGGGGDTYRIGHSGSPAPTLTEINSSGLGFNLTAAGQSGVSNKTNSEIETFIQTVNFQWNGGTNQTKSYIESQLQNAVTAGDYTSSERDLILSTLNSKNIVVFAKAVSGTEAMYLIIKKN